MAAGHVGDLLESVQLLGVEAQYVLSFKYLGGGVDSSVSSEVEVNARISKAKGRFARMQHCWSACKLPVAHQMQCFQGYVLPVLLFGGETWLSPNLRLTG
jgi:hypothetical protein